MTHMIASFPGLTSQHPCFARVIDKSSKAKMENGILWGIIFKKMTAITNNVKLQVSSYNKRSLRRGWSADLIANYNRETFLLFMGVWVAELMDIEIVKSKNIFLRIIFISEINLFKAFSARRKFQFWSTSECSVHYFHKGSKHHLLTKKSSSVTAKGILPATQQVLALMLCLGGVWVGLFQSCPGQGSYPSPSQGRGIPVLAGGGGGREVPQSWPGGTHSCPGWGRVP